MFLDEPTNGLDPQGRDEMLSLVEDIGKRDVHIVLSTHLLPDVERVCDSVIMLHRGQLVHSGTISALQRSDEELLEVRTHLADDKFRRHLQDDGFEVLSSDDSLKIRIPGGRTTNDVLALAAQKDVQIRHFMPERLTLETAFLQLLDEAGQDALKG